MEDQHRTARAAATTDCGCLGCFAAADANSAAISRARRRLDERLARWALNANGSASTTAASDRGATPQCRAVVADGRAERIDRI
jgi:hypothetical protein